MYKSVLKFYFKVYNNFFCYIDNTVISHIFVNCKLFNAFF